MTITIYVLLGLTIASVEAFRFSRRRSIDAMTFFNFYYLIFFVFAPVNVILLGEAVVRQKYAYEEFGYGDEYTALAMLFSYVLFQMGYVSNKTIGSTSSLKMQYEAYSLSKAARISYLLFAIGLFAMSYHVAQVGGLLEVIQEARNIRSGEFAFESKFVFIRQFIVFLSSAFVLFLTVHLSKKINQARVTATDKAILVLMAALFLYYVLSAAGRREFIYPVMLYYLVSSSAGRSFSLKIAVFAVLVLVVGKDAATLLTSGFIGLAELMSYRGEIFQLAYLNTVQGIADPFVHFVGMQHADIWQFGFLRDIFEIPLQLIPSRLFDFDRGRGVFGETSRFFLGSNLADGLSGEEPPGLHGYLLVNFGYFGMFLLFFVLGLVYRLLHNVLKPAVRADAIAWLIYWWVFFGFLVLLREGVLVLALKQHASWWLAIGLLILTRRRQVRQKGVRVSIRSATLNE